MRFGHQILRLRGLRERNDVAKRFFACEQHRDPVYAERDPAMRRRAVGERVEEKAEALFGLFVGEAKRLEHTRLHVLAMNSYAAGAQLDAVEHKIVALRAAFPRRGFQLVEVFFDDPREGMLRAHPALIALA